ncbi:hypothetical protein DFP72DRAFT_1069140 [Ephemerocybe angulata]|uniref:CCHC-type domain-containing protein n=1 Tax=Ephemerocybe angulata TaxID=980116 RepID=A0A8H6HVE1_9AGAR|nr:hypothetical protein DFP72DRAFT_1069140 [Tulosesus angulatus]
MSNPPPKPRMPAPYGKNHPTYDPEEPGSAIRFFEQVKMAADEAGIEEGADVIKWALSYLPDSVRKRWAILAKDGATQRTFDDWQKEVMKTLPRRAQEEAGALARLDALVTKWSRDPVSRHDRANFFDFSLGFQAEASAVSSVVSNRELVRMYLRCLTPMFRERLQESLTPQTNARDEDPYLWTDVVKKSKELVVGGTTGPFGDLSLEPSTSDYTRVKIEAGGGAGTSRAVETIKVKQEEMESSFQTLCSKLDVLGVQMKEVLGRAETSAPAPIFQQGAAPPRSFPSHATQRPRQGMYTRPPHNPFNTPPRICYYCHVEGHMLMACPVLDADKVSGRVTQQGYNIFVNHRQLSKDSPDGLSMKQRADAILAGTYNPPAAVNLLTADDWGAREENALMFLQSEPESVPMTVFQQSMDRMRSETQGAIQNLTQQLLNSQWRPPVHNPLPVPNYAPSTTYLSPPPDKSSSVPASEVKEMFQLLSKRLDSLEQYQIQTRSHGGGKEGFQEAL